MLKVFFIPVYKVTEIFILFLGKIIGGKIVQGEKDGGKVKEIEWVDLDKFSEIDFRPEYLAKRLKNDFEKGFPSIPYFN